MDLSVEGRHVLLSDVDPAAAAFVNSRDALVPRVSAGSDENIDRPPPITLFELLFALLGSTTRTPSAMGATKVGLDRERYADLPSLEEEHGGGGDDVKENSPGDR